MIKTLLVLMVLVVFTAEDCDADFGSLVNKPGTITVSNIGTEPAVIAIITDDVASYPTLAGGGSATIKTNVGGRYEVRVVMTPENAAEYRAELTSLRRLVEKAVDGTTTSQEKTALFLQLAGIKAAIQQLSSGGAAGCSGTIKLNTESNEAVSATVAWTKSGTSGFWDTTCGSN